MHRWCAPRCRGGASGEHACAEQRRNVSAAASALRSRRAVIFLFDQRRLAQIGERGDQCDGVFVEYGFGIEIGD